MEIDNDTMITEQQAIAIMQMAWIKEYRIIAEHGPTGAKKHVAFRASRGTLWKELKFEITDKGIPLYLVIHTMYIIGNELGEAIGKKKAQN